jgi:hypothetical protein
VVRDLSQDRKGALEGQRERDLEREFRPRFEEYEEWRASQDMEPETEAAPAKEGKKKKGFGKLDILFLGAGFIVAMLWRGCKGT